MEKIEIPGTAGAILLPECITFPHGALPLHIFEPRYRKMLEDALAGDFMICVGNLTCEETANPEQCTSSIGIIGLIRASHEQEDGRSNLILHGITRVRFLEWHPDSPYPKATIKPIPNLPPPVTPAIELTIRTLRAATNHILRQFPQEVATQLDEMLDRVGNDLAILTDVIAQQFVNHYPLRETLLGQEDPVARAEILTRHLRTQKTS